jgi:hypothetical protein
MYVAVVLPVVIQLTYDEFQNITLSSENKKITSHATFTRWNNILAFRYITDNKMHLKV